MRAAFVAVLLVAGAGLVAAHEGGDHVPHIMPTVGTVEAGASVEHRLEFEEGPLRRGWVFALVIGQEGGSAPLTARAESENGTVAANWTLAPGGVSRLTTLIPETGEYLVALHNPGNETARYAFYFDQSCNCAGKPVPKELMPGLVIFNVDGEKGQRLQANFPQPRGAVVRVTAAVLEGARGAWPDDFRTLASSEQPVLRRASKDAPAVPIHEIEVRFPAAGRIYFFVEPVAFAPGATPDDLLITPFYEPLRSKAGPAPGLLLSLAAAALAFAAWRRRA